jgi:hypothetical protein
MIIFLSSTIYDFGDLRSAIKFWLEDRGHKVLLSEEPDFGADAQKNSLAACLQRVKDSDAYILLVGNRTGTLVSDTGFSITRLEYQTAYEEHKKRGMPIISFCRRVTYEKIVDLKRVLREAIEREKTEETIKTFEKTHKIEDAKHTIDFVDAVRKVAELKQTSKDNSELPTANWLNLFDSFEDIILPTKRLLDLQVDIRTKSIMLAILGQLKDFLLKLSYRIKSDGMMFYSDMLNTFREKTPKEIAFDKLNDSIEIPKIFYGRLVFFAFQRPLPFLNVDALRVAAYSQELLEFDTATYTFRFSELHYALKRSIECINVLNSDGFQKMKLDLQNLLITIDRSDPDTITMRNMDLIKRKGVRAGIMNL